MTLPVAASDPLEAPARAAALRDTTELLRTLIRNQCVRGDEDRSVETLCELFSGSDAVLERVEPSPGRASLVVRVPGRVPDAPRLLLLGHLDVVEAPSEGWSRPPFEADLVDGEVWGRGAVDMLAATASMAVATRAIAESENCLEGDLVFAAVADEETGSAWGTRWLVDNRPDLFDVAYAVTEFGGARLPSPSAAPGPALPVMIGEKGCYWCDIRMRGTPGHASMPLGAENALTKTAVAAARLGGFRADPVHDDLWEGLAGALRLPGPAYSGDAVAEPEVGGLDRLIHAVTHTTVTPTMLSSGSGPNVVPDEGVLRVDVRTPPGADSVAVTDLLLRAMGDVGCEAEITFAVADPGTRSTRDSPLWGAVERAAAALVPGATLVPMLAPFATDAKYLRNAGVTVYGFGLYSEALDLLRFLSMMHGVDERVDLESLELLTSFWTLLARDLIGGPEC